MKAVEGGMTLTNNGGDEGGWLDVGDDGTREKEEPRFGFRAEKDTGNMPRISVRRCITAMGSSCRN